jgi:hypothetical protein
MIFFLRCDERLNEYSKQISHHYYLVTVADETCEMRPKRIHVIGGGGTCDDVR